MRVIFLHIFVGFIIFLCAGCSDMSRLWKDRYGPPAIYEVEDVQAITQRQLEVLRALAVGAGLAWPPPLNQETYWYNLTRFGFNVVDDQCTEYMEDLFGWERKRNRTKDILTLGAASAATVLGITNAGQKSLVLTAQAFGLASGAWTIVADSYLYKLNPATIASIEEKLQASYRTTTDTNRAAIDNGATAYQYLRGYLTLCLPVTIENKVAEYLAQTKGEAKNPDEGNASPSEGKKASPASARLGFFKRGPSSNSAATPQVGLTSTERK